MKKLLLTLALAAVATCTYAQGTIQFANGSQSRFLINGIRAGLPGAPAITAGQFTVAAYAGLTADAAANATTPAGPLGTNHPTAGLVSSASPQAHTIDGFAPSATVFIQIRIWESRYGNWQEGQAGLHGASEAKAFVLGPSTGPGVAIWNSTQVVDPTKLQAINLIPEPSTIALAVLGLGSLLLFRRRK
jgi:hypothetical protein